MPYSIAPDWGTRNPVSFCILIRSKFKHLDRHNATNYIYSLKSIAMNKTLRLLFYPKKSKINSNGLTPIYLRITIDSIRTDISSKGFINAKRWNNMAQKVNGTCQEVRNINSRLKSLEIKVYKSHMEMVNQDLPFTSENLKNICMI